MRAAAEGISVECAPFGSYLSPVDLAALRRILASYGPDLLVSYDERALRSAALVRRRLSRPPILVHYHGLEGALKNKWFNRRLVDPQVTAYVPNAAAIRDELLRFGWIVPSRIQLIYDGVDPAPLDAANPDGVRAELETPPDVPALLVAARLAPEKGHSLLLRALVRLESDLQYRVWIAGEGPAEEELKRLAESLGLQDRVRWLGFRSDVPRLMRAADILCHPSRREGAPNAVREAMCAALPVAAVRASGTPELVVENETALLSEVDDEAGLAQNLLLLLRSPERRRAMGEAGRRRALEHFSEDRSAELWLQLFERCLHRG